MAEPSRSNAIIPFLHNFEMDKLTDASCKVTVTTARNDDNDSAQTTQQKKAKVPIIPVGATKHQLLHCPHKFQRARVDMHWTNGPQLFELISNMLEDPADIHFWENLSQNECSHLMETFDLFMIKFVKFKFANNMKAHMNHWRFLVPVKKPKTLLVQDFTSPLQHHDQAILP